MVIVRNSHDVPLVWKSTKALTFDYFAQSMHRGIGVPESSISLIWEEDPTRFYHGLEKSKPFFIRENPLRKKYFDIQEDWIKEQLQPGPRMDEVQKVLTDSIVSTILRNSSSPYYIRSTELGEKTVSLFDWCRHTLVKTASEAFLGPSIFNIDADFVQHYIEWDNTSWKVAYRHPQFLARDMQRARQRLIDVFMKFYSLSAQERPRISWLFDRMQSEQQMLGLPIQAVSAISILMLWGYVLVFFLWCCSCKFSFTDRIHLNTHKILFWVFAHIVCNDSLYKDVSAEIKPAVKRDGSLNIDHLTNKCVTLNAVWSECLRLYTVSAVVRNAVEPAVVGGKTIHPGNQVMAPFRFFHLNNDIFGDDALNFSTERWLTNKALSNTKGYYPFGGGKTLCPGRTIAKQEVFSFIATALTRFEVEPVEAKRLDTGKYGIPQVDLDKPALTTLDPKGEFLVHLKQKK